jgi:hypothetical protein
MIFVTGGFAVYFLESGAGPKRAPDGLPRADAIAPANEEPLDSADDRAAMASRSVISSQPVAAQAILTEQSGGQAALAPNRAPAENWDSAVETLRQLANTKNLPPQTKAGQPEKTQQLLQQLEAWRKGNNGQ